MSDILTTDPDEDHLEQAPAPAAKRPATPKPGRARKGVTPADVRAVLRKHDELTAATDEQRTMLADALGKPGASVDELTVVILTSPRIELGAISDLTEVSQRETAVKRAIAAMQLTVDRARAKSVWHLLSNLGVVRGKAPGSDGDLAEGIATAVDDLTAEHTARLGAITALASR